MPVDFSTLQREYPDQLKTDEPLARYTVARLGGAAAGLFRANTRDQLLDAVRWANQHEVPWLLLGGGANVLASDAGYDGLVIINAARGASIDPASGIVVAESGTSLTTLARRCIAKGVAGFEWAVNVPGTLGGAIVNNAGAHDGDMAHILIDADVYDGDEVIRWTNADFQYDYRYSALKGQHGPHVVLSGRLGLTPGQDPAALASKADAFVAHRKKTQPPGASLGSMFKNPPGDYAGRLIEAAGLKGHRIGGVQISPVHANFFINLGSGRASDYSALIDLAQQVVYQKFGVQLELEVERIGDWE